MRIAFYAPLKHPAHPVPSGDRAMARAFRGALRDAGFSLLEPSTLRSFLAEPDDGRETDILAGAALEIERIAAAWDATPPDRRPDFWFTYHNYYKAPDLLGPTLSRRFGIPYGLAEASHAAKRKVAWGAWHDAASRATREADLHVCMTARDRQGIEPLVRPDVPIVDLPPFVDLTGLVEVDRRQRRGRVEFVAVAMMRAGDKLASYRFLADALADLPDLDWHLTIVGDGPARGDVAAAFSACAADRLTWRGELAREDVIGALAAADVFVWPGFGEAFGVAYLEAQATGLPVVALDVAGVSSVVAHGRSGLLVGESSPARFAAALRGMTGSERLQLGRQAARMVREERSLVTAADVLGSALRAVVERGKVNPC